MSYAPREVVLASVARESERLSFGAHAWVRWVDVRFGMVGVLVRGKPASGYVLAWLKISDLQNFRVRTLPPYEAQLWSLVEQSDEGDEWRARWS